jgi:hypothetical protein
MPIRLYSIRTYSRFIPCLFWFKSRSKLFRPILAVGSHSLTNVDGLNMREVVGMFTGKQAGVTYFQGQSPIDEVWATSDMVITGACVMPAGFRIGDHCMFVIDMIAESIMGLEPQRIVCPKNRQLNSKIPGAASAYRERLECLLLRHRIIEQLGRAHEESMDNMEAEEMINVIDREGGQYMMSAKKKCQKSGWIPFSPNATVWIQRCQIYCSILQYHDEKIHNQGNLKCTARRFGIRDPLNLHWKRFTHGCKFVKSNVNISDNMDTDIGKNICRIGCSMHGKQMMR